MSQISKISINGTEYNLSEKLSSYYTSYSEPALPSAGDSVETAISKLHTDVELISRLGYLSEDYTAYETILYEGPQPDDSIELAISKLHRVILDNEQVVSASLIDLNEKIETVADNAGNAYLSENYTAYTSSLGVEPQPNDSIELAISKLHKVILDDEYAIASSLIDLNKKSFHILYLNYNNNSYTLYDEKNNEIQLDGDINLYDYVNDHSIIKYYNTGKIYYPVIEYNKFISIDNQTIYWIEFTSDQQDNYIIQTGQQPLESKFINSTAYNISQADITNWNSKLDSFTETDPTVASYIKAITQSDISNWNSKLDSFTETDPTIASYIKAITQSDITNWNSKTSNVGTITGITMNGASKGTSGVVDLGTILTEHQTLKTINNTSLVGSGNITINENVQSDWNASSGSAVILNKPTIPTVNDTTVTLTMNGSTVGTFTLNKNTNTTIDLGTVLTAHQSLKTINNNTITGTGNISIQGLPTVTSSDNGKILMVVNGEWQLVSPVTLYSGSGAPNNAQGNNGDIYVQS